MTKPEAKAAIDTSPALNRDAFICPRCNAYAHQEWSVLHRVVHDDYQDQDWPVEAVDTPSENVIFARVPPTLMANLPTVPASTEPPRVYSPGRWSTAECMKCKEFSTWRDEQMIYPTGSPAPLAHGDMPPEARELYDEARNVVGISRRAGAALARATLERLLKGLDDSPPKGASLAVRIDAIMPAVSSGLGKMLTVIRHVGNKSLHVEEEPDDAVVLVLDESQTELVYVIFSSINALVDELITKPKLADSYVNLIPEKYLENVKNLKRD